jgi:hypothetical protein
MKKEDTSFRDVNDEELRLFAEVLDLAPESRKRVIDAVQTYEWLLASHGSKMEPQGH